MWFNQRHQVLHSTSEFWEIGFNCVHYNRNVDLPIAMDNMIAHVPDFQPFNLRRERLNFGWTP